MLLPDVYYGKVTDGKRDFRAYENLVDSRDEDEPEKSDGSVEAILGLDPDELFGESIAASTSFTPSAAMERQTGIVPEVLQPADKQDAPLEPTPDDKTAVVPPETFDDDDLEDSELMADLTVKAPVKTGKATHYETLHGADAVHALRAQHQAAFENLLRRITGPIKAKVIGSIARQAAKQLKAKVPAGQLQFNLDPKLENLAAEEVQKIYDQSRQQVQTEVKARR